MKMYFCDKCSSFGLWFHRAYEPHEFIEGDRNAEIWIIGLNPTEDAKWVDLRTPSALVEYFDDKTKIHGYFKQFRHVSERLYERLGKPQGVAHTDLVKCSSRTWPPDGVSAGGRGQIISNCAGYLKRQLAAGHPKVIICNGSEVSTEMKLLLPPPQRTSPDATNYVHRLDDRDVVVVLSGFIGRLDNFSRRRLGIEIEGVIDNLHRDGRLQST